MSEVLTFERVWAMFQETDKKFAETREQIKELTRLQKEHRKEITGIGQSNGDFAEEYFYNSFKNNPIFAHEKFDYVLNRVRNGIRGMNDEYDIVLYNGKSIAIIEVKYKVEDDDIEQTLKKAQTFKILFPQYKDFVIYLGLAGISFPKNNENRILSAGIAVVKQVGENVVVMDERVKKF